MKTIKLWIALYCFMIIAVNVSCTKKVNSSENSPQNDSVQLAADIENLVLTDSLFFDSIYYIYINNRETYEEQVVFDNQMTTLIDEYSKLKGENLSAQSKVKEHANLVAFLAETFPDSLYAGTQKDMNFAGMIDMIEAKYLMVHYEYLLTDAMPTEKLKELKSKESKAWYDFARAQSKFQWDVMIDGGGGSCAGLANTQLNNYLSDARNEGNLALYFKLHQENYKSNEKSDYKPIEKNYFDKEYAIYAEAIKDAKAETLSQHSVEEKLQALKENENSFNSLLEIRQEISQELEGELKSIFDKATYRIQKIHLINLKNNYSQYGCNSDSAFEMYLKENDSHQKVLNAEHPFGVPTISKKEE